MKKIIILLVFLSTAIFAQDYVFWVETPEMVKAYENVFTAIKSIFGSTDYLELLKLLFLVGGFFTLAAGVFKGFANNMNGVVSGYIKYILIGTALLVLIFSSTSKITIMAENNDVYCTSAPVVPGIAVVDGFPTILGAGFNFVNKLGILMLDIVEEVYTQPSDSLSMRKGGYNHSIRDAMAVLNFRISMDTTNSVPDLSISIRNFIAQCITVPFSGKGSVGLSKLVQLKSSANLFAYFDDLYINTNPSIGGIKARDYTMDFGGGVFTCGDFYDKIRPGLLEYKINSTCFSEIDEGALSLIVGGGGMPPSSTFSDVALQAGLVSELEGSLTEMGIGVSGIGYATGKSRAEAVQTYLAQGQYMAGILPVLQMTLRAIVFAFFPFVFIMAFLPGGLSVLKNYTQSLIWIELWTPVAGILNMFLNANVSNEVGSIYGGTGLTLMSSLDMLSTTATISGIAGYLYAFVPGISWAIISGTSYMLESMGRDMAVFMQKNIQTKTMNLDAKSIAKTREASVRAGKDLSMAEMLHYEAIQSGRMEGAKLAEQMKGGMDTVSDIETMNETKNVEEYKLLSNSSGLEAEGIGKALAGSSARKKLEQINIGSDVNQGGTLRRNTIDAARSRANETRGSDNSNAKNPVTVADAEGAEDKKTSGKKADAKFMSQNSMDDVVNANANAQQFKQNYNSVVDAGMGGVAADLFNKNTDIANDLMQENIKEIGDGDFNKYKKEIVSTKSALERQEVATQNERKNLAEKNHLTLEEYARGNERVNYRNKNVERQLLEKKEDPNHPITENDEVNNKFMDQVKKTNQTEAILNDHSRDWDKVGNYFYTNQQTENFDQEVKNDETQQFITQSGSRDNAISLLSNSMVTEKMDTIAKQLAVTKVLDYINESSERPITRNELIEQTEVKRIHFTKQVNEGKGTEKETFIINSIGESILLNTKLNQTGEYVSRGILRRLAVDKITQTDSAVDNADRSDALNKFRADASRKIDVIEDIQSMMHSISGFSGGTAALAIRKTFNYLFNKKSVVNKALLEAILAGDKALMEKHSKELTKINNDLKDLHKELSLNEKSIAKDNQNMTKKEKEIANRNAKLRDNQIYKLRKTSDAMVQKATALYSKLKALNAQKNTFDAERILLKGKIENLKLLMKEHLDLKNLANIGKNNNPARLIELDRLLSSANKDLMKLNKEMLDLIDKRKIEKKIEKKEKVKVKKEISLIKDANLEALKTLEGLNKLDALAIRKKELALTPKIMDSLKGIVKGGNVKTSQDIDRIIRNIETLNKSGMTELKDKKIIKKLEALRDQLKAKEDVINKNKGYDKDKKIKRSQLFEKALPSTKQGLIKFYKQEMLKTQFDSNGRPIAQTEELKEKRKVFIDKIEGLIERGRLLHFKTKGAIKADDKMMAKRLAARVAENKEYKALLNKTKVTYGKYKQSVKKGFKESYIAYQSNAAAIEEAALISAEKTANKQIKLDPEIKAVDDFLLAEDKKLELDEKHIKIEQGKIKGMQSDIDLLKEELKELKKTGQRDFTKETKLKQMFLDITIERERVNELSNDVSKKRDGLDDQHLLQEETKKNKFERYKKYYYESSLRNVLGFKKSFVTNLFEQARFKPDGMITRGMKDLTSKKLRALRETLPHEKYSKAMMDIKKAELYTGITNQYTKMKKATAQGFKGMQGTPMTIAIFIGVTEGAHRIDNHNSFASIAGGLMNMTLGLFQDTIVNPLVSRPMAESQLLNLKQDREKIILGVEKRKAVVDLIDQKIEAFSLLEKTEETEALSLKLVTEKINADSALDYAQSFLTQNKNITERVNKELSGYGQTIFGYEILGGKMNNYYEAFSKTEENVRKNDWTGGLSINDKDSITGTIIRTIYYIQENVSEEDYEKLNELGHQLKEGVMSPGEYKEAFKKTFDNLLEIARDNIRAAKMIKTLDNEKKNP